MSFWSSLKHDWLQPFFYFGNNRTTLIGSGLTTASAVTLIFYWIANLLTGTFQNPYLGLIFFLGLPGLFVLGLLLIPFGMWRRRIALLRVGPLPTAYPEIHLGDPLFRRGVMIVIIATAVNLAIVSIATYRGVTYMDSANFCGQSCHVMAPQWSAYQESPHSHVACVECHVGSGMSAYVEAKVNGAKQLVEVTFNTYPRPITVPLNVLRPARATCEQCHTPARFVGDRLLVLTSFGDDKANTISRTVLVLHLGGVDSLRHQSGIHGAHLNNFTYLATDSTAQMIIAVSKPNPDGSVTQFVDSNWKGQIKGIKREMDCMDCHNQATHVFKSAKQALDEVMVDGSPSPDLPFVHKVGLQLIRAAYHSQNEAAQKIISGLNDFYRTEYPDVWMNQKSKVDDAARTLVAIYKRNVFPDMKVTWGTYPDNIGHQNYPGCFRCHDGNHIAKNGQTLSNDCSLCHNLLAIEESNPKVLSNLGLSANAAPTL
jgi:nitrate/TMAO reductase-like tetraheme cytochrome c subunit